MADKEVLDDDAIEEVAGDDEEEEGFEEDLDDANDLDEDVVVAVDAVDNEVVADDEDEDDPTTTAGKAKAKAKADEDAEDDDDEADPDDVEEDLDTILRDRIAAGADDDDEDDEAAIDVPEGGDRVAPRAAEEFSCPECFLLVRRSQFSTKRTDCPGGLDGEDCPMKQRFA